MSNQNIAVVGSGISGLAAAWLLSQRHRVTLIERGSRLGGHSNTLTCAMPDGEIAVDTGFIVYNEPCYPNLTALFAHLKVPTAPSAMSFSVSMGEGAYEYAGSTVLQLVGHARNLVNPAHLRMVRDLLRFLKTAALRLETIPEQLTLAQFIRQEGYSAAFAELHLLPMAGAIWSSAARDMRDYPARAFIRFFDNHGLLRINDRPQWRTVKGGSQAYVSRLVADGRFALADGGGAARILRRPQGVTIRLHDGSALEADQVVIATHADQALRLLDQPGAEETRILGGFAYSGNRTFLHTDPGLMPRRRRLWSSWNYLAPLQGGDAAPSTVSYWMNSLQPLPTAHDIFVTLNPPRPPRDDSIRAELMYEHPIFNPRAMALQKELWSLQGNSRTWFCGAYFGAGFHEDGLQAGLAVAEQLGGLARPWTVAKPSGRIHVRERLEPDRLLEAAE
ncbi:MAG: FAD-dependent oxidoreductase [Hyphomicrobiales bacterium]